VVEGIHLEPLAAEGLGQPTVTAGVLTHAMGDHHDGAGLLAARPPVTGGARSVAAVEPKAALHVA
jgi:hypothetical protein